MSRPGSTVTSTMAAFEVRCCAASFALESEERPGRHRALLLARGEERDQEDGFAGEGAQRNGPAFLIREGGVEERGWNGSIHLIANGGGWGAG